MNAFHNSLLFSCLYFRIGSVSNIQTKAKAPAINNNVSIGAGSMLRLWLTRRLNRPPKANCIETAKPAAAPAFSLVKSPIVIAIQFALSCPVIPTKKNKPTIRPIKLIPLPILFKISITIAERSTTDVPMIIIL